MMDNKRVIKYYRIPEQSHVFLDDPNTGAWRIRKNGKWINDDLATHWLHKILWNCEADEEETTDPKVYEEWITEADRRDRV